MRRLFFVFALGVFCFGGDWQMFSDTEDTYIYNTRTGEIYVRHKKGGENYKDEFVKMPPGRVPAELKGDAKSGAKDASADSKSVKTPPEIDEQKLRDLQQDALKKSQEMLQNSLEF